MPTSDTMERVDVREWGTDASALQAAVDTVTRVLIPEGLRIDYEDRSLLVDPGTDVLNRGELVKVGYPNYGGTRGSFIRNRDFGVPVDGFRWHGDGVVRAVDHTKTGNVFALSGARIRLRPVITCWAGGRAMVLDGDHVQVWDPQISGSPMEANNGGIRVVGGYGFRCYGGDVVSGDDALQFVPSGNRDDPFFNRSITAGRYIGTVAESTAAKAMVAAIQSSEDDDALSMDCSITDVGWTDVDAVGGVASLMVQNLNSTQPIDGVTVRGGSTDLGRSRSTKTFPAEVIIRAGDNTGGVRNVTNAGHVLRGVRTKPLRVSGNVANVVGF